MLPLLTVFGLLMAINPACGFISRSSSFLVSTSPKWRHANVHASAQQPIHNKHKVIFVLGGPGSGKGTQCAKLVDEFGFTHLSAGELLRSARASGTEHGQMIDDFIKQGKIVPVAVSLGLLKSAMDTTVEPMKPMVTSSIFLVDGFPRNADNVQGWNEFMAECADVLCVLFMDCSQEEQEKRVLSRGLTSGRTDDNLASARKRFATYELETLPVVELYGELGLLRSISAEADPHSVYAATRDAVLPFLK